jgi:hypothetical protein
MRRKDLKIYCVLTFPAVALILAVACDKVYQLLAHGRWFSPDSPASSTTKTGRHDIAEILLKVVLKHNKSLNLFFSYILLH